MRFNCSALVLDFTAYTRDSYVPTEELGQVTRVAKHPDSVAQSNGFDYVIEECSSLPTKMRGYAVFLQPRLSPDVERNV
jgi:hypothetical protein